MPFLQTRERVERERLERETGERDWIEILERERDQQDTRDGAMADGLTQTNEVDRETAREDIWSYLDIMVQYIHNFLSISTTF